MKQIYNKYKCYRCGKEYKRPAFGYIDWNTNNVVKYDFGEICEHCV